VTFVNDNNNMLMMSCIGQQQIVTFARCCLLLDSTKNPCGRVYFFGDGGEFIGNGKY
jgi:hypothetical protein